MFPLRCAPLCTSPPTYSPSQLSSSHGVTVHFDLRSNLDFKKIKRDAKLR